MLNEGGRGIFNGECLVASEKYCNSTLNIQNPPLMSQPCSSIKHSTLRIQNYSREMGLDSVNAQEGERSSGQIILIRTEDN